MDRQTNGSIPLYAPFLEGGRIIRLFMKMFKTNNMELDRTCISGSDCPVTWVLRAQRKWDLAILFDYNYHI